MKWKRPIVTVCISTLLIGELSTAQQQSMGDLPFLAWLYLAEYVSEVLRSNLDLAAQHTSIAISQAQVTAATARPDWSFDVGLPSVDLSNQGSPTTTSLGLTVPIQLGGKRNGRVRAATADVSAITSDYEDAVRQLTQPRAHSSTPWAHAECSSCQEQEPGSA